MTLFRIRPIRPGGRPRWDPWREMEELRREMERINERAPRSAGLSPPSDEIPFIPEVDVYETGAALTVKADLPGVREEDLEITIEGSVLSICGKRPADETEGENCLGRERPIGRFLRAIDLPAGVEAAGVKATLRHGVLEITLPKSKTEGAKKIPVAAGAEGEEIVSRVMR